MAEEFNFTDSLKEILGDSYNEDVEKNIKGVVGKNFVSKNDFNRKNSELKATSESLEEMRKKMPKENTDSSEETKKMQEALDSKTKAFNQFRAHIELAKAGARNEKAVAALIDWDKVTFNDDSIEGLSEQLEALKKDEKTSYEFQSDSTEKGAGGFPSNTNKPKKDDKPKKVVY